MSSIDTNPQAILDHIFKKTYLYAIPAYERYSREYREKVGFLSSGDPRIDHAMMNELVNVGGTIEDILRLYERGVEIKFQNPRDMVTIYEVLNTHLNNWADYVSRDPNVKNAPVNSLQLMSEFSESIRPVVIGYKPKAKEVPKLAFIQAFFGNNPAAEALFNNTGVGTTVQETAPVMDRIEEMMAERNKNRKKR